MKPAIWTDADGHRFKISVDEETGKIYQISDVESGFDDISPEKFDDDELAEMIACHAAKNGKVVT